MIFGGKTWVIVCGSLVLGGAARAVTPDAGSNPYSGIVERNVFSLKDPPPPKPPAPPPAPPVKITLTGITTILGNKRALMRAAIPPKPPEPAKEESYMLAEGQRDGTVEVLAIDEKAGTVRISNGGTIEMLDFINNGAKVVNAPTPVAGMSPPGMPTMPAPPAAMTPSGVAPRSSIPTRNPGTAGSGSGPGPGVQPNQGYATTGSTGSGSAAPLQFQNPVAPEEQTLMIEGQRMYLQQQGKTEDANMLPFTDVSMPESGNPSPF
jgi:hypothetical protein